jgi:hypothetical protein
MSATTAIMLPTLLPPENVRQHDARAWRDASTIIDVEPVAEYVSPDRASRVYRDGADARSREYAPPARAPRPRHREDETTSLGFAAQRIAQEELSAGLYFENFKPAIAAYAAADSNFTTVRRPPLSNFVIYV